MPDGPVDQNGHIGGTPPGEEAPGAAAQPPQANEPTADPREAEDPLQRWGMVTAVGNVPPPTHQSDQRPPLAERSGDTRSAELEIEIAAEPPAQPTDPRPAAAELAVGAPQATQQAATAFPAAHQQPFPQEPLAAQQQPLPQAYAPQEKRRSWLWILLALLAVLAIAAILAVLGGLLFVRGSTDEQAVVAEPEQAEITSDAAASTADIITSSLVTAGYDDVEVEERDGTIYLTGSVASTEGLAAATAVATADAKGAPVNTDGLVVAAADPAAPSTDDSSDAELVQADPLQRLQVTLHRTVAANPIIFEPGTTSIESWQEPTLDTVAATLLENPGIAINVVGYTDDSGAAAENEALSMQRAEAVRSYLIGQGIVPGLIKAVARGESEASGIRDIGYLERRVEFEVVAATADPPPIKPLSVGIIVPSPRDDLAFSQSLVDALNILGEERGGLTLTITDNMFLPDEGMEQARQYVADGADVVILHGAEFLPIIEELATDYPDVVFISGPDGFKTELPNVFVYVVYAEQGAYVLGDLAASLTDSGTIGVVGPIKVPEPQRYVDGFAAGAEANGATVLSDYVDSFFDTDLANALAQEHIDNGADILTGTAELVVGPIDMVKQQDLIWFSNQTNQSELAPDNIVAAQVYRFEVALREILAEIDANATSGGEFPMTLGNGGMLLEFNPDFPLDRSLRRRADQLLFDITAGSLNVEVDIEEE